MILVVGAKNVEKPSSVLGAKIGVLVASHAPSSGGKEDVNDEVVVSLSAEDGRSEVDDVEVDVDDVSFEELIGSTNPSQLLNTSVKARGNKIVHGLFILHHYTKSLQLNKGEILKHVCKERHDRF